MAEGRKVLTEKGLKSVPALSQGVGGEESLGFEGLEGEKVSQASVFTYNSFIYFSHGKLQSTKIKSILKIYSHMTWNRRKV